MASNTKNLDLLMKNPSTDGADAFNVQTMLNENWQKIDNNAGTVAQTLANILKPTTPPLIGLPPSTTPDGMFRALGNTGELHVWRKTTVSSEPVPAGYTLGDVLTHGSSYIACQINGSNYVTFVIQEATSITVNDNGTIEASWGSNVSVAYGDSYTFTPNRFVKIVSINANAINSNFAAGDVVWVPSDGKIHGTYVQQNDGSYLYYLEFTKCQKVNAHGIIPAGTTTTYPVSTNPNAYQEGIDAKEAGYVVGDVVSGSFLAGGASAMQDVYWNYSDSLNVSDDGALTLKDADWANINTGNSSSFQKPSVLLGKFAQVTNGENYLSGSPFAQKQIVYIPSNAVVSGMYIDRYQPVTGYAAIPEGTTIEYLGKLGDKARVQVVSYVGTGTYGESNPCSITAGFKIKAAIMMYHYIPSSGSLFMISDELSTNYTADIGFSEVNANYSWGKKSADGKTLSWYGTRSASGQFNDSGYKYYVLCIG